MDRSPLTPNLLWPPRYLLTATAASAFLALTLVTGCETNQAASSDGGGNAMAAESSTRSSSTASSHRASATREVTGIAAGWEGMEALSADAAS